MRIIDRLTAQIRSASIHNPDVQAAPACILWPDKGRQWETAIPRLLDEMPELFILGEYDPEHRTGPAIWLRCVIAGKIETASGVFSESAGGDRKTPVLYLPGVSRQDLRAVEQCPNELKPLAELQYRGVIWSQINARDWTILAFLKSHQGGLGLDAAQDQKTKTALQLSLYRLLDEEISLLEGKHLDRNFFNTLLAGGDPVRDLLRWLDRGDDFRSGKNPNEWLAFVEICKSQLGFDPEKDGEAAGAARLANREGPWRPVWERFCESPKRYKRIPDKIRRLPMPPEDLLSTADTHGAWPQWNEARENELRADLNGLAQSPPYKARKQILELERRHGERRNLVWAELGEAQLALALKHLAALAEHTESPLAAGSFDDLAAGYLHSGWRADAAALDAIACISGQDNFQAVSAAVRAVYLPWLETSARHLQKLVRESEYPGALPNKKAETVRDGECILFVDGLRLDLAKRLIDILSRKQYAISETAVWSALPTVTATCKPSVSPVREYIAGNPGDSDFTPSVAESGQSLKGGGPFKKLMSDNQWRVLDKSEYGDGTGVAWCEIGSIDHEGHARGCKMADSIPGVLVEILERIEQLLFAGWKTVHVRTDHGWLLMPGGLPGIELPKVLTDTKWGRCAAVKEGAKVNEPLYSWHWNPDRRIALADGVACYRKGLDYAHGGLSLQEALVLNFRVSAPTSKTSRRSAEITDVKWVGMRCKMAAGGEFNGLSADIRRHAGESESSVVMTVKCLDENGRATVVIDDEDDDLLEGAAAFIVLIDENGEIWAQADTVIGGVA